MSVEATFRIGAGRVSLDLIRTLRHRGQLGETEEIPSASAWTAWLARVGLDQPVDETTHRDREARALREHIAALLCAVHDTGLDGLRTADLAAVNRAAAAPTPIPHLQPDGSTMLRATDPGGSVRSVIARDALDLIATGDLARLRRCANSACRTLFYDTSRPGQRRWCSMQGCGNQSKKTTQRRRTAHEPTVPLRS